MILKLVPRGGSRSAMLKRDASRSFAMLGLVARCSALFRDTEPRSAGWKSFRNARARSAALEGIQQCSQACSAMLDVVLRYESSIRGVEVVPRCSKFRDLEGVPRCSRGCSATCSVPRSAPLRSFCEVQVVQQGEGRAAIRCSRPFSNTPGRSATSSVQRSSTSSVRRCSRDVPQR